MELILTEMLSLAIVIVIAFGHRAVEKSRNLEANSGLLIVAASYSLYLLVSIISHLHINEIFQYGFSFARFVLIIHILTVVLFICAWMVFIQRTILEAKTGKRLALVQWAIFLAYVLFSLLDMRWNLVYQFTPAALLSSSRSIIAMIALSLLYVLNTFLVIVFRWNSIQSQSKLLFLFSCFFITISLIFFQAFRQPYLLGLSSTFLLVLFYLAWQRREMLLDSLTRVPNREAFQLQLTHLIHTRKQATLLLTDIENFRSINERFGFGGGNALLRKYAASLQEFSSQAKVFRAGGNRFLILFPRLSHPEIVRFIKYMQKQALWGWEYSNQTISYHVNCAIVELPLSFTKNEEIMDCLEFTLSRIKNDRRLPVIIFNQRLFALRQRQQDILSALRRAMFDASMIVIRYQPIIAVEDTHIHGVEALMRLKDEHLGLLNPQEFIPLAEQAGLITSLTKHMLSKVGTFMQENPTALAKLSHVSVNITIQDLLSSDVIEQVLSCTKKGTLHADKLAFELTESMAFSLDDSLIKSWSSLHEKNIRFMLDDFGTGYANLESLIRVPFETVKIDRSVVSNAYNGYTLLSLVYGMLTQLGKQVIAEGVETQDQLDAVKALGIPYVQGYYFSKPVSESQLLAMLEGNQ